MREAQRFLTNEGILTIHRSAMVRSPTAPCGGYTLSRVLIAGWLGGALRAAEGGCSASLRP
jgi:hypothetical protein